MPLDLRTRARRLRGEVGALAVATRDPRTPWIAKALIVAVVAYAVSPIDLIPDPIPILGLLDDLVLLPIGIALAIRLVPDEALSDARAHAELAGTARWGRRAGIAVAAAWLLAATVGGLVAANLLD